MSDPINDAINEAIEQFEDRPLHISCFAFQGQDHRTVKWSITLGYTQDCREAMGKTLAEAVESAKALPPAEDPIKRRIRQIREEQAKLQNQLLALGGGEA